MLKKVSVHYAPKMSEVTLLFSSVKRWQKTVPLNSLTCHQCQDDQHIWHGCFKRHEHIEKNHTFKRVLGTQCVIVVFIPFLYSSIKFLAIWHVFLWKGSLWCRGERKAILSHIESIRPVHSIYEGVWNERKQVKPRFTTTSRIFTSINKQNTN